MTFDEKIEVRHVAALDDVLVKNLIGSIHSGGTLLAGD
jgi:hypothetical protein